MKPSIKLACMSWIYMKHPFERALESIAATGYKYVSFGLPHEGKPAFDDSAEGEAERISGLLRRYGLKPVTLVSTDVLSPSQPIEKAISRLEFAKAIGVDELLSLGTTSYKRFPDEPKTEEEMKLLNDAFAEKYRRIGEEAGKRGIVVTIKPHTGNTATAAVIADTLRTIGSPHILGSYDPGNVRFYEGIEPSEDLPAIAAQTVSLVAKDHRGKRAELDFPIPGEGDVDFASIFATLRSANFSGPVVVERLDGANGEFSANSPIEVLDERVKAARINLERLLAKAGFEV
ncbi:sugar phosphate isomerase/epimerase [Paenibacillus mesophilus]|uniref:sugar phosphate isomerase/epimerase family protein n=1 Tax=Paenibacillus mesophilus TaxID=2582849 RepID=UPI00110ECE37|nr:sugar phosphate isomerase/epimerase [Paenibacillus mesophilus]TMV51869.1 sugar phosphate isomerase/epimerase [Paenibacillus mesophilus]